MSDPKRLSAGGVIGWIARSSRKPVTRGYVLGLVAAATIASAVADGLDVPDRWIGGWLP